MSDVTQLGKYQPYPEYKNSGVEWLGKIPFNWTVTKVKRFASFTTGWTPPTGNELFFGGEHLWANISDIGEKFLSSTSKTITDAGIRATKIKKSPKGSLLFSFKLSIGQVSIVSEDMYTNEAIATFLPSESLNVPYMYWAAPLFIPRNAEENIYGAKLLNQERISNADFVLPSTDEQCTIAAFLDYETARIDQLIAKQQQLIELLKEKRQAVISHAVTKGLNPNAPMKDSGVEWLGQVPEHWVVMPIRHLSSFVGTGGTPKDPTSFTEEKDILWFSPGDFNGDLLIDKSSKYVTKSSVINNDVKIYSQNSVLIVGIGATLGKVAVCQHEFSCNQQINIVTPNSLMCMYFMAYSLLAQTEQMKQISNASTIGIMNQEKTKNIRVAMPSLEEQNEIINYLKNKLDGFSKIMDRSSKAINLLQERRTALISAAVTGKIDLRGWQPPKSEVTA